ncbi:MAG: 2'-5' RNA ligase family protein [Dehalococcoidales bacterium]|nr:2'-5' RNA ligase family protein [Dehalococcoidales bacterium]
MKYFYIEFRFHRYPKNYLKGLINEVAHEFSVKGALNYRPVPHMTLYGPSQARSLNSIFSKIEKVAKRYTLIPFEVCDFDFNKGKTVIGCRIHASVELENLRKELALELNKIVKIGDRQPWDNDGDYWFHTTIAMKDIDRQFRDIWRYVNDKEKPHINQHLVRVTVLNNKRKIEREYDLMFQRWLSRREALSKYLWRKTINRLRELKGLPPEPEKRLSIIKRMKRLFRWL